MADFERFFPTTLLTVSIITTFESHISRYLFSPDPGKQNPGFHLSRETGFGPVWTILDSNTEMASGNSLRA
jgi:hypothetical protein